MGSEICIRDRYEIASRVPVSTQMLQKFDFSVVSEDSDEVLTIVANELAKLSLSGVPESELRSAVARDRRQRILEATEYKSVSLDTAQQWLADGEFIIEENIVADKHYLDQLALCLNEPLQKMVFHSIGAKSTNSDAVAPVTDPQ